MRSCRHMGFSALSGQVLGIVFSFNCAEYYFYNQPRTLLSSPPPPTWMRHPLTVVEDVTRGSSIKPPLRCHHQPPHPRDFLKIQGGNIVEKAGNRP